MPNASCYLVMVKAAAATGIPIEHLRLIFGGKQLALGKKISDYNLNADSCTLQSLLRLRGGAGKRQREQDKINEVFVPTVQDGDPQEIKDVLELTSLNLENMVSDLDLVDVTKLYEVVRKTTGTSGNTMWIIGHYMEFFNVFKNLKEEFQQT